MVPPAVPSAPEAAPAPLPPGQPLVTGILLFDGFEELDAIGPWEVFGAATTLFPEDRVLGIAREPGELRAAKGLRVLPQHAFADAPRLDVLIVPGGRGVRTAVQDASTIGWLREAGASARWVASVCTGTLLLHEAGFARGRRVITHWSFADELERRGDVELMRGRRYVRDGKLVTAAGVSAGIDMSLWLLGQLRGEEAARRTQRYIEYDPAPPYAASV